MHPSQGCASSTSYQVTNNMLHQLGMQDQMSTVMIFREKNQLNEAQSTAAQINIKGVLFYYQAQSTEAQNTVVDALPDPFI